MVTTLGATKALVELPILRCLKTGDWKEPGEIKDYVARYGGLPAAAKKPPKGRESEPQSHNTVQNAISASRAGSLTHGGLLEYNDFKGKYRLTAAGRVRLEHLESLQAPA